MTKDEDEFWTKDEEEFWTKTWPVINFIGWIFLGAGGFIVLLLIFASLLGIK